MTDRACIPSEPAGSSADAGEDADNRESSDWRPTVAVIMPCHNSAQTIDEAIQSVFRQTFEDWQLLIVDDGSTDDTPQIIAALAAREPRIRILRNEKPSGASAARNKALSATRARYVAFLDSDDAWLPRKLEVQLAAMRQHNAALVCGAYDVMDAESSITGSVRPRAGALTYRGLLLYNSVGTLTAILDRSLCGDIRFDTTLPRSEDYQLWLTIAKRGLTAICVPETVGIYRVHANTLSSNKLAAARNRWQVYRRVENAFSSSLYFLSYVVTSLLKTLRMRYGRVRFPG